MAVPFCGPASKHSGVLDAAAQSIPRTARGLESDTVCLEPTGKKVHHLPVADQPAERPAGIKSFLIADVRGYTAFTQVHGDEAAAKLASRFAELVRAEIENDGGSLIELRGDEALAVFDSARQAIRTAIVLQGSLVDATIADPSLPLAVGIGLDAGEAVPVDGGYRGGALNLAARLCSLAGPGEVLASREVAHLAGKIDGIKYVTRGSVRLKGLTDAVEVVGVRPELEDLAQDVAFRRALGPIAVRAAEGLEARNPYKGLRAFEEADAVDFFGREELTQHLVARLADTRFLAVVGPSGSGKSSVVRAGLVPALRQGTLPASESWRIVEMFPGAYPLEELEAALLKVADSPPPSLLEQLEDGELGLLRALKRIMPERESELVLVVDQLEELFTLVEDEGRRSHFLSILEHAVDDPHSRLRVVTTLRADFYDRPLLYPGFAELLRDYVEALVPLTPDGFERAIAGPANRVGVTFEPGLLADMVADVANEPGALPLLQYALTELYERREGDMITRAAYEAIGGVAGALAGRAEEIYGRLSDEGKHAARQLFLRLVTLGEGTEDTRRRADRGELASIEVEQEAMTEAVDGFGTSRLLSFDRDPRTGRPTVEIAHEALLREWDRLRRWVDSARENVRIHRRLAAAAGEWDESGREPSFLLRGSHLAQFEALVDDSDIALTELERNFVNASRAQSELELARQLRTNRRLRALLAGVVALLAAALAGGIFALLQRQSAQDKARVALARQLGAQAVSEPRIDRALLLARESVNLDRSPQTEGTMLSTLLRSPAAVGTLTMPVQIRPRFLAVSLDGRTLVVSDNHSELRFYGTDTRRPTRPPLANVGEVAPVRYSPDGSLLLALGPAKRSPEVLEVLDARTLKPLRRLIHGPRYTVTSNGLQNWGISPDNRIAFHIYGAPREDGGDGPSYLDRWDVATGRRTTIAIDPNGGWGGKLAATMTNGGRRLVTVTKREIATWDAHAWRRLHSVTQPVSDPSYTAISPDGRTVAVATRFGTVAFVDVATGTVTRGVGAHGAAGTGSLAGGRFGLLFSPDGRVFVSTGDDAKVIVWDPGTGRQLETLLGHSGPVFGAAFSADGKTLYTAGQDGAIFEWDLGGERRFGRPFRAIPASQRSVPVLSWAPQRLGLSHDGLRLASQVATRIVGLFSAQRLVRESSFSPLSKDSTVTALAWSPSGPDVVVAGNRGQVEVWNAERNPRRKRSLAGLSSSQWVWAVAISPDGRAIAAGGGTNEFPATGEIAAWGSDSSRPSWRVRLRTRFSDTTSLAFSPDGKLLAAALVDGRVLLLDAGNGQIERTLQPFGTFVAGGYPTPPTSVSFGPDGSLLIGTYSGIVQRWNATTGKAVGKPVLVTSAGVSSLSFSPDGALFATLGEDGVLKLWSTATLQQHGSDFPKGTGSGNALFSPNGETLTVVHEDGRGFVWPVSPKAWEDHACAVAGRNLTREEWRRYVTGHSYTAVCPRLSP
jgi:WD40 repeat protein/class 3 adenylate cyclase